MSTHYFTPNTTIEFLDFDELESSPTCDCCDKPLNGDEKVQRTSQKVGYFSGNYMLEHDYEYSYVCLECVESSNDEEEHHYEHEHEDEREYWEMREEMQEDY